MAMSYSRLKQMLNSIPANARKVYDITPIAEGWSYSQIHQEMQRLGHNMRSEVIMGCVATLKDSGLVVEASQHRFQRAPHKPKPELHAISTEVAKEHKSMPEATVQPIKTKPAAEPPGPVEKLGGLAVQMRQLSQNLAGVADDLDLLAMDIEERADKDTGAAKELAQIKATFKSLGLGG